jgi:hypothetical protein
MSAIIYSPAFHLPSRIYPRVRLSADFMSGFLFDWTFGDLAIALSMSYHYRTKTFCHQYTESQVTLVLVHMCACQRSIYIALLPLSPGLP